MRVRRGRASTPAADRTVTTELVEQVASDGEPALRVWQPHRQVAFGRRDRHRDGYDEARAAASERGYAVTERAVGGHAVAFTGTTVAFVLAEPVADGRQCICDRYERATDPLVAAFEELGVAVEETEPPHSFCPGTHSLSAGGKIAGLAQRVRRDVATVAGVVLVSDHDAVADVLAPIYCALEIPFDPETVGSIARAGGESDPDAVCDAIEHALAASVEGRRET
jgi:octanoyl-[GcvH]:protein N-octanoyltransferase